MEEHIQIEGRIMTVLAGTMFRVELDNKHQVLATISGKMRKRFVRLTVGDRVKMEMSQYDLNKARIVWRLGDPCGIILLVAGLVSAASQWNYYCMNAAILVAAGKGTRMGAGVEKLFLEVAGRPVVAHTWQRFDDAECIGEIILVVRKGMRATFSRSGGTISFSKTVSHRSPGALERQDSVWNGLQALSPGG